MSSAERTPRFDPQAAAQQMLELGHLPSSGQSATPALLPAHAAAPTSPAPPNGWAPTAPLPPSLTDRGNARLFIQRYRDQFRHVEGLGWYSWDGYRWKRTGGEKAALWAAGEMAEDLPSTDPTGQYSDRELAHHKKRTLSTTGIQALLTQAKASPDLSVDPDTLDGDPYALVHPRRRRRPAHRAAAQTRPRPRLPLPRHQRRPPADEHPPLAPLPLRHVRRRRRRPRNDRLPAPAAGLLDHRRRRRPSLVR